MSFPQQPLRPIPLHRAADLATGNNGPFVVRARYCQVHQHYERVAIRGAGVVESRELLFSPQSLGRDSPRSQFRPSGVGGPWPDDGSKPSGHSRSSFASGIHEPSSAYDCEAGTYASLLPRAGLAKTRDRPGVSHCAICKPGSYQSIAESSIAILTGSGIVLQYMSLMERWVDAQWGLRSTAKPQPLSRVIGSRKCAFSASEGPADFVR